MKIVYNTDKTYLQHHGILGQKWGVRRFQNADGSYTNAGKKRRYTGSTSKSKTISRPRGYVNKDGSLTPSGIAKYGTKEKYDEHRRERNRKIKAAVAKTSAFTAKTALHAATTMALGAVGSTVLGPILGKFGHEVAYTFAEKWNIGLTDLY